MKPSRIPLLLAALFAIVVGAAIWPRLRAARDLESRAAASLRPVVSVVVAAKSTRPAQVTLPAAINALQDTPIYARTTGYIGHWKADIGDRVRAGDVLAQIEGPDLDQELNQAKAALEQAQANQEIARISAERWRDLGAQNAVAQQEVDQKAADYAGAKAAVGASRANVERLTQLKGFQQVTAPYDGVITARNTEVGALISAGAGKEIYHIAQTDVLRITASVPQANVRSLKIGTPAEILVPEFPGRVFRGEIARFSGALDSGSRTLETEVRLANPTNELLPGMYCEVRFSFLAAQPAILLPSNAAIITPAGTLVATVDASDRVHLQPVTLGRDFGSQIEVLDGLSPGTRVIAAPRDSLTEGLQVTPLGADGEAKP